MKHTLRLPLIVFLALTCLTVIACRTPAEQAAGAGTAEATVVPVEVAEVGLGDIALIYNYAGDLKPRDQVNVMPGAAGRIKTVMVEVGQELKAGDPIAVIEQDVYETQLRQAEIGLQLANLNLTRMETGPRPEQVAAAQAAVELARASLEDATSLNPDERAVALAQVEQARNSLSMLTNINDDQRTVAASNLAQAEAALRRAQAEYDKIAWAGQVEMTPQALQLQQATIAYQTALAGYNMQVNPDKRQLDQAQIALDTAQAAYNLRANPSDAQLAPLLGQLTQAQLNLALTENPYTDLDYEQARLGIKQAQAALEQAKRQLDETVIKAPFDGVVAELYVSPGSSVGPGMAVALFASQDLEVIINIEENRISQVTSGQYAGLTVTAYPGRDFGALVTSVAPQADANTHTFQTKVTPADETGLLRGGMFANVSILVEEHQNTPIVPRAAVVLVNDQPVVYVVGDDLSVEARSVTTGLQDQDRIEITAGLQTGETVVTAGQQDLLDGVRVEVVN